MSAVHEVEKKVDGGRENKAVGKMLTINLVRGHI